MSGVAERWCYVCFSGMVYSYMAVWMSVEAFTWVIQSCATCWITSLHMWELEPKGLRPCKPVTSRGMGQQHTFLWFQTLGNPQCYRRILQQQSHIPQIKHTQIKLFPAGRGAGININKISHLSWVVPSCRTFVVWCDGVSISDHEPGGASAVDARCWLSMPFLTTATATISRSSCKRSSNSSSSAVLCAPLVISRCSPCDCRSTLSGQSSKKNIYIYIGGFSTVSWSAHQVTTVEPHVTCKVANCAAKCMNPNITPVAPKILSW